MKYCQMLMTNLLFSQGPDRSGLIFCTSLEVVVVWGLMALLPVDHLAVLSPFFRCKCILQSRGTTMTNLFTYCSKLGRLLLFGDFKDLHC